MSHASEAAFLALDGVRKAFPGHVAVAGVDLDVRRGSFVSLLGPSGCGKTTTLRMIAGFESPTDGRIRIDGRDVTGIAPDRRDIGMVFQSYALFPNMSVADNIGFGLRIRHVERAIIRRRVAELLELVHLDGMGGRFPWQLSGGMQQRVALARALAPEPQLLLLDEPLSALDARIRVALRQEIRSLQRQLGITTVYVTHDQEEALSLSDVVVVMNEGRVEQVGSPMDIYGSPVSPFVATFVGTLNVLPARVLDANLARVSLGGQALRMAGGLAGRAIGESVTVAIRPEALDLDDAPPGDERETLAGIVDDVTFLGPNLRVRLRLDGDAGLLTCDRANRPDRRQPEVGRHVQARIAASACILLAERTRPEGAS